MGQFSGPTDPAVDARWDKHEARKGFFTDTSICIGCKACEVACKEWNHNPADGDLTLLGSSYDNSGQLGADTWRHVAFVEQAGYDSRWGRKILKRETIHTYDAILALHLAKYVRAARDEPVLITREEIHELFAGVTNTIDRDLALFDKRIERALDKMEELEFLRKQRDDTDTFIVSPVISAVMTASVTGSLR